MATIEEILNDLSDEYERLDRILAGLSNEQWLTESGAPGWTVCDVMVHLATSEEGVAATIAMAAPEWTDQPGPLDDTIADMVVANRAEPGEVFARWRAAIAGSLQALASADPEQKVSWAAAPLKPVTLATTRLAEHWAHALDVTEPLGIDLPDTSRLRHIAWLGHGTIPYGCSLAGIEAQPIRAELTAPDGDTWTFGPADAASVIRGSAGLFCRVGAQRLAPAESGLETEGPFATEALSVLRNYAA